ncbi:MULTISPECIES: hypothetical protein [unclassified Streptomyces]|uniref:hypothetical protein n=1 Tax=unclassified Streptomyces TaxID=2593676 RepID=UPI002E196F6A|nr:MULTISPECIES: hypothetical protein [unclassified Streptomyces]
MVADAPSGGGLGSGGSGKGWDTPFNQNDLDKLKQMVSNAKPQTVKEVAQNWTEVREHLVGSDGSGGLKQQFDNAVKKVLEKWKGSSADKFRDEAGKISQEMANGGNFADLAGRAMDNSADELYKIQDQVQSIDVDWWDRTWDAATDMFSNMSAKDYAAMIAGPVTGLYAQYQTMNRILDAQGSIQSDLASGMKTQDVIDKWGDSMGADQQGALQAAIHMERLGNNYKTNAASLNSGDHKYTPPTPPHPNTPGGPGDMNVPGAGGTNPGLGGGGIGGGGGVGQGIPGFDANGLKPPTTSGPSPSQIGTGLDSAGPGLVGGPGSATGAGGGLGAGGGIGGGAGAGAGGAGLGGGMAGGMAGGLAGGAAGLARGAGGGAAGRGAAGRGMSGGGAGRGTGAAGRGMGGMGGGAGAGGGAAGKGLAGKTGAGARLKGGAVGGAKGKTGGAFTPGGTGLRNRGAGAGGAGAAGKGQNGRSGFGPAGAAGGRGAGKQRGEGGNNSRLPDYLTEDKETWTPKDRKANPPVIE